MVEQETTVRKRRRRKGPEPETPEEFAAQALDRAELQVDGRIEGLPCHVCGQFPGSCVDGPDGQPHAYLEPTPLLDFAAGPTFVQGVNLPDPDDQIVVDRLVEVPAVLIGNVPTWVLKYKPGDIISRAEAVDVGLLVDLRKGPAGEPKPIAVAALVDPRTPVPPAGYALDLDAAGARPYMPPQGGWNL